MEEDVKTHSGKLSIYKPRNEIGYRTSFQLFKGTNPTSTVISDS